MPKDKDTSACYINPSQLGGIDRYTIDDGPGRGVRCLCINTGAGLRYRILLDRGCDIDQAFFNQHSLSFLTHQGVVAPSPARNRGAEWLKGFPGGLLTSCGPFNVGRATTDNGEELGLHGTHSNTPAELEAVYQPSGNRTLMAVVARLRYGKLFGPCLDLKRTISSQLGLNRIDITDEFQNAGNQDVPHAWLLHINFGYPLLDEGSEFCYRAAKVDPVDKPEAQKRFAKGGKYKLVPAPLESHRGNTEAVAYLYPEKLDATGMTRVGLINRRLNLGVAIQYNVKDFPRCVHWQHFGPREYVAALEPANAGVVGRDKDRAQGWLETLPAGGRKIYRYSIEALCDRKALTELARLNSPNAARAG